jgi:RNA polymerase-binding transcription factor DksA
MKAGERAIELAEFRVAQETAASVQRIRQRLTGSAGRLVCDCGEPIPEARRRAVPNTTKCFECACRAEARMRRRA